MAETSNYRLRFPAGEQRKFIISALTISRLTNEKAAQSLGISVRTLTDWKREKLTVSEKAAKKIERFSGVTIPPGTKRINQYWYVKKGAKLGAQATIKKYGAICNNEQKRLAGWRRWWNEKGQYFPQTIANQPKKFYSPAKSSKLAEFVGIMLGDGGITEYQVAITLNKTDDKDYATYVTRLLKSLFRVRVSKTVRESVTIITISRVNLVKYCQKIGLKKGHKIKQQIDIPEWIKQKKDYSEACLRGLVDTDGSVFTHSYYVRGKLYSYKKLDFSSRSKPLIKSVKNIFQGIGTKPRIDSRGDIRLDNVSDVRKFFKLVGSNNPKHIRRFKD